MAEFVQLRKEKWVDPVDALRKLEILREDECRSLVRSIDSHEYKIQSPNRKLEDVLGYVQFLSRLLKDIQRKRKLLEQYEQTEEVDRFIYNEIASQFGSAEINFGHNIAFWNARLQFVATVVPELDRENEFNRMFQKALKYCAKADLNFYKYCVDFQWSLLKLPPARHPADKKRKRKKVVRKDCSKYMSAVRGITMEAHRNFSRSAEASIWVITTELKYLCILKEEEANRDDNDRSVQFDINEETEKTEKLIQVLYRSFKEKQKLTMHYCQLCDEVSVFSVPQAKLLSKTVFRDILTVNPRPIEVSSWLITSSVNENKIDECLVRIEQALSSSTKVKVFEMCLEKLIAFLRKLILSKSKDPNPNYNVCLSKLIQFSMKLFDPANSKWEAITSEVYLTNRIHFVKILSTIHDSIIEGLEEELALAIKTYLNKHPLEKIVRKSVEQCPSSFVLVNERVYQILQEQGKPVKSAVIFKYLSGINWRTVEEADGHSLFSLIYRVFQTTPELKSKTDNLLKLPIKHSAMDQFRILHLKIAYLANAETGRNFYLSCSKFSSDWRFACAALEIEKDKCRRQGEKAPSRTFTKAVEDVHRLAGTSSTEPWKIGVSSLRAVGNEKEASRLLERALSEFSSKNDLRAGHKDLLLFSRSFTNAI